MKVILLKELKGRGGEGDVIDVAQGFAENYLLPQKIAIKATKGELKQLEQRRHNIEKRELARTDDANKLHEALDGKEITILAKVGEEGQLFGSVTTAMIADAINEQIGIPVDRKKIDLGKAIKVVGEHEVSVTIYRDIKAAIKTVVLSDDTDLEALEAAKAAEAAIEEAEAEKAAELEANVEAAKEAAARKEETSEAKEANSAFEAADAEENAAE